MSEFSYFMKQNKSVKANVKCAVTQSLKDSDGNPLIWEIKAVSTRENERIREQCTNESGAYRGKLNTSLYVAKLLVEATVYPDLYNAELQDSYNVRTPEELIKELIDSPGEYQAYAQLVQSYSGFDVTLEERIQDAKN